jgi:hypothetical protein
MALNFVARPQYGITNMNITHTHYESTHPSTLEKYDIPLSDAKFRIDGIRGPLWLLADHARHGIEIPDELLEALLFRCDRDLSAVSDAIRNELYGGGA